MVYICKILLKWMISGCPPFFRKPPKGSIGDAQRPIFAGINPLPATTQKKGCRGDFDMWSAIIDSIDEQNGMMMPIDIDMLYFADFPPHPCVL